MRRRPRGRGLRDARGETLIEFALASTLFFGTLFGIISFSIAVFEYNTVANLAREGARYAAVHGSYSGSVATSATVQTYLRTRSYGMLVTAVITCGTPTGSLGACQCSAGVCSNDPGNVVQVRVTQSFTPFTSFIPATSINLGSTSQMIIAR